MLTTSCSPDGVRQALKDYDLENSEALMLIMGGFAESREEVKPEPAPVVVAPVKEAEKVEEKVEESEESEETEE